MSVESDLKKDGIEIVGKIDTLKVNSLAHNIAIKLCKTFPDFSLNQNELFMKLSRLTMYIAKMPEGMSEANYFYKNSSIYFNEHIPFEDIEEFAIHECIHYLQEVKDKKNYLIRMGLCDYTEFKIYGLGLNEAAVQLMASKVNGIPRDYVKYYGIHFETTSPSYYPLECCLVNQLAYLTGENILYKSTLFSDDEFKTKFASLTTPKTFLAIQNAIDDILYAEEDIIKLTNKIAQIDDRNKKIDNLIQKIDELKQEIKILFMRTQNLIISSYFDHEFETIQTIVEIEKFRKKLYHFKDLIGTAEGYTFFNDYYIDKMAKLEHKHHVILNGGIETALSMKLKKENKMVAFFHYLKRLILGQSQEKENDY